ncbi:MAG: hypothetical protein HY559_04450 [Gammaproteobacteria bacterium]|nr:hypothetical protein [Gammaproteobacteria bacterium]
MLKLSISCQLQAKMTLPPGFMAMVAKINELTGEELLAQLVQKKGVGTAVPTFKIKSPQRPLAGDLECQIVKGAPTTVQEKSDTFLEYLDYTPTKGKGRRMSPMGSLLKKRSEILKKIATFLVEKNEEFFLEGKPLKPCTKKACATAIEEDYSLVSRCTTDKHTMVVNGVKYKLSGFFTQRRVHSETIQCWLKETVAGEDPQKPFSDTQLVSLFNQHFAVAVKRRVMAKYRAEAKIGDHWKRRKISVSETVAD